MTVVPKNTAPQEPCQEVQIILGAPGGLMMEYSLRQKRNTFHHLIPFLTGFDRYGFTLRLQAVERSVIPIRQIDENSQVLKTTVKWFTLNAQDRNIIPVDEDPFEQRDYQATRFVMDAYFCVAIIHNPPARFDLGGTYIPELYTPSIDEYKALPKDVHSFKASFSFRPPGLWHVYNVHFDDKPVE